MQNVQKVITVSDVKRSVLVKEKVHVIQCLESASVHWVGLDSGVIGNVKQATMAPTASIRATAGTMPHATKELVAVNALLDGMGSCATKVGTSSQILNIPINLHI